MPNESLSWAYHLHGYPRRRRGVYSTAGVHREGCDCDACRAAKERIVRAGQRAMQDYRLSAALPDLLAGWQGRTEDGGETETDSEGQP